MNVTAMKNNLADFTIDEISAIAGNIAKARMFESASTTERAFTQLIIGQSLGLNILQSLNDLIVGKKGIELRAVVMASLVKRHPKYDYRVLQLDEKGCSLAFFEVNEKGEKEQVGISTFTHADAVRAHLDTKETYKQYPKDMFFSRAMSSGAKKYASEAIGGASVYVFGELDGNEPTIIPAASNNVIPIDTKQRADVTDKQRTINQIREIIGSNARVNTQVNKFLACVFGEGVSLNSLDQLNDEQLAGVLERVREHAAKRAARGSKAGQRVNNTPASKPDRSATPASEAQKKRIFSLCKSLDLAPQDAEYAPDFLDPRLVTFLTTLLGADAAFATLSKTQASNTIDAMQGEIKNRHAA